VSSRVLALCLAAVLGGLLCAGIQEMALHGHHGWSLARRGVAARNTLRHGLVATRFAPVETLGEAQGRELVWYANHPALTSLLCAGSVAIFGEHEWAERIVPITATLAAFLLLVGLCRRARGPGFAAVVGLAVLSMPIWTYYGSFVNHEPIVVAATVGLVAGLVALREGRRGAGAAVALASLLGTLDDWSFSFVLAPVAVWALLDARRRGRARQVLWLLVPAAVGLAVAALHALSLPGQSAGLFGERLYGRSALTLGFFEVATNPLVAPRFPALLGPAGGLLGLAFPFVFALRRRRGRSDALDGAMLAVWAGALMYCIVLAEGLRNHDYWVFLFAPVAPVALATVLAEVPAQARGIVTAGVLAVSIGLGLLTLHDFRRLPSEIADEWPSFRLEQNVVMRHVRRRTDPDEVVFVEENVEMVHQSRYYLDRSWSWFRGQVGLGDWAIAEGASVIVLPASVVEGDALAELGSRFLLTALGDHWIVDLRRGPGAVDARRLVFRPATGAWRYLRSLVYDPYRVVPDGARAHDLTAALWTRLGRPPPPITRGWRARHDLDARVARANAGDGAALDGALSVPIATRGTAADLLGARLEARRDGGLDVWVLARAGRRPLGWNDGAPSSLLPPLLVWVSDMPERAADWTLWPRVPQAWWRPGTIVAFHRVVGLTRGTHDVWLRGQDEDAFGLGQDVELGTVRGDARVPWVVRY
jgi:hypothetical protein